jgi:hypothetical protein
VQGAVGVQMAAVAGAEAAPARVDGVAGEDLRVERRAAPIGGDGAGARDQGSTAKSQAPESSCSGISQAVAVTLTLDSRPSSANIPRHGRHRRAAGRHRAAGTNRSESWTSAFSGSRVGRKTFGKQTATKTP